ncbi:rhomboid family intramembrane serine protease [soil metagenome]
MAGRTADSVRSVATEIRTCYRHGDRRAGVVCQRCDRPICPDCMHTASVGFHCPECTKAGAQKVLTPRSLVTRPLLTQVVIGVNVGVFLLGLLLSGGGGLGGGANDLIVEGALIARGCTEATLAGCVPGAEIGVAEGEWWRVVTSGFLHYGWIHLAFNMYALWILGQFIEGSAVLGRFAAIYLTALVAGSFGAMRISADALTAGASGAIYGLMGAALAAQRARGVRAMDSGLLMILGINLLLTFSISNISVGGHLGGLAGGLAAGYLVFGLPTKLSRTPLPLVACGALAAAAFLGTVAAAYAA